MSHTTVPQAESTVNLAGRVIVITGAGSGIGRALAEGFRADKAIVVGGDLDRGVDAARDVCDLAVVCDVRRPEHNDALVAAAMEQYGRVDCFVANAGIGIGGTVEEQSYEHFQRVIQVNLEGVFLGFKAALRPMRAESAGVLHHILISQDLSYVEAESVHAGVPGAGREVCV